MNLEIPIPVNFHIKMETTKAFIVTNVILKDTLYIKEAVIPKMYTQILDTEHDVTSANVEKWILQQRHDEENNVDVEEHINDLIAVE